MRQLTVEVAKKHLRLVVVKDDYVSAACPFHKEGQELHPSFWIARSEGKWGCFRCQAHGEDLRELLRKLGKPSTTIDAQIEQAKLDSVRTRKVEAVRKRQAALASFEGEHKLPEALLGVWDHCPTTLLQDGFDKGLLRAHDVGFDSARHRITFPLRDVAGNLIGVSGRTVTDEVPKYKIYSGRRVINGVRIEGELGEWFPSYSSTGVRDHIWRGHLVFPEAIAGRVEKLVIVEGFKACLWLVQQGFTSTVALIGARMSQAQERIVRRMACPTYLLLDNNEAGRTGSKFIGRRLGNMLSGVYVCTYPEGSDDNAQPDDLTKEGVEWCLDTAKRTGGRRYGSRIQSGAASSQDARRKQEIGVGVWRRT